MKKILAEIIALTLAFAAPALAQERSYTVGICQLVQHEALDDAARGFKDSLSALLGDRVRFIEQNASGDSATCISIINSFIAEDVDLILANSTQALQAAWAGTGDIPILGVSVTDYAAALDMDSWTGVTGVNVSGTSDLPPVSDQAELMRELYPDARSVGLLYCSAEANSEYQATILAGHLTAMGYECAHYTFTDTNDVFSVTRSACDGSDVIFVPTDNTIASCTQLVRNVVEAEGTPIVGGDAGICAGCGVATLAVNYYDLGCATGQMAYDVLEGGKDVSAMPVQFVHSFTKVYNPEMCALLGVSIPEDYEPITLD